MKTDPTGFKVGILDADLGGLRLAAAIQARWPLVTPCYLADTAHAPIGGRSPSLIGRRLRRGLDYLNGQGADVVILASQTMAAMAAGDSAPDDGPAPINPVRLAAVLAAGASVRGAIGVIAGRATVESGVYPRLIRALRPSAAVHAAAAPLLVPLLDEGRENKPEGRMIVKKYLHRLKVRQVDTLILGASRLGPIGPLIQRKIGPRVRLIDPLACTLEALADRLPPSGADPDAAGRPVPRGLFMVTDLGPGVVKTAQRLLKQRLDLTEVLI